MPYENMSINITRPTVDNYYAFFFIGVCNQERYVISLRRWTNLLHEMYGYPLANIRILVGTYSTANWGNMIAGTDVTYNATRTDLDNALADYATGSGDPHELGSDDNLFIFTFNHGDQDPVSGCYLCCDTFTTRYYASDFANRINAIQCNQIVYLAAQCHSGGFVDPFINGLSANTWGAIMAGTRSDLNTWEAIFDKLFASAFNGRMVQNALDDNIDLDITGDGMGVDTVPGYNTDRIDWGPTGCISTREAFNWVYDHYVNEIFPDPNYAFITDMPLYRQSPWTENGEPVHIRLGEPDLIMQDCVGDTGEEPSTCVSPWHSPDLYPDNTDQFPAAGQYQYVPEHHNRFFIRTANRGTAPTDDIWKLSEVRGLGFSGGPVGPMRIDRAMETDGIETLSARLRPGRAHSQFERILIGGDFGHGCISALCWSGVDEMDHTLWHLIQDNDQVQCNIDPASVSGATPVSSASTNSNAGLIMRTIPIFAEMDGVFEIKFDEPEMKIPVEMEAEKLRLKKGETGIILLKIKIKPETRDGEKGRLTARLTHNDQTIGGVTFLIKVITAYAQVYVLTEEGNRVANIEVMLIHPGDPRRLVSVTDKNGIAVFGPLNSGFYYASVRESKPVITYVKPGKENPIQILIKKSKRPPRKHKK